MIKFQLILAKPFLTVYENDTQAYVPEFWANESLAILEESMVMGSLVHRDFEPTLARFGELVNTRRPGEFTAQRKTNSDNVTIQDAAAVNVQVPLNQHIHVSFMIKDGEESKSMKDLIDEYMKPAMLAQARIIDQILLGQVYQFLGNAYGPLGGLTGSNSIDAITGVRNIMNINKAYMDSRNLVLTPSSETVLLRTPDFTQAHKVGDDGTALRKASLGEKFGFDIFMCQNTPGIAGTNTKVTGAVNNVAGYAAGSTTATVDGLSAAITAGTYFVVAGDSLPHRVVSTVGGATPTSITFTPGLGAAVVNDAVITLVTPGAVNQSVSDAGAVKLPFGATGYQAGWSKAIVVDGFTVAPQVGQMVSFGASTATATYAVIGVPTTTSIVLDRPLDADVADNATVNLGPAGQYNFAFHRNALTLVVRPLALPRPGIGATSAVINVNGLSMRATLTYNGLSQGTLVTLDMLCGFAILDTDLGAVLLG